MLVERNAMKEYEALEPPGKLFGRIGSALALETPLQVTYNRGEIRETIDFLPSRMYAMNGKTTCGGTVNGQPAQIHIELDVAIITLHD